MGTSGGDIDTVALFCVAVVGKDEYDSMQVEDIAPVVVRGKGGTVTFKPIMLVGSVENTRSAAADRVNEIWKVYASRLEQAKRRDPDA